MQHYQLWRLHKLGYIGRQPTGSILTGADIADGSISTAKLADTAVLSLIHI